MRILDFNLLLAGFRNGEKASLSKITCGQIIVLWKGGESDRSIREKLSVSKTAVHQAIVKFKNSGLYCDRKRR